MVLLQRLLKNRKWLILVLLLIISIMIVDITSNRETVFKNFEIPVITALSPAQKILSKIGFDIKDKLNTIPQIFYLKEENEALKQQVAELLQYKQNLLEYQRENTDLRNLLGLKDKNLQYDLEAAEVIARDTGNWFNVILIDKGEKQGLKKDMAVITNEGLVGSIISTTANTSKVMLITDERSSVSAMLQRTRDNGIIKGSIDTAPRGYLKMDFLSQDANLVKGDIVISSGLGGLVPKGIVIGEVVETEKESYELMQYAIVKPAVDFLKLERVFVIKGEKEADQ
ncbi:Cell shape-determining protein MreC [Tepidanaerobacter acetatoxydans Re1]|uniref:Cell shape-determining protein MreC n=1 Tax=Tepidanaerobacter acetatoxydans (strain DSM 21804 / JCM 16047 / Re1) TaxID=1209989 RepID=F4LW15_TEPAE|nr:rod shape-determining protein MreC [Tepidanaerobacter acetatoxydans]AEE91683.1 rod shape-determining protein MreC [Tepidanaerobacter acetatoxydans Re1]CDI40773.1 Cell shape-determining protein MreC [Tepidanaerobacter acetatoxydans Re1]